MTQPTTTVRIRVATKARLEEHRSGGQSIDDVISSLGSSTMTSTEVTQERDRIAAYLRTHLLPTFLDQDEASAGEALWRELGQLQHPVAAAAFQPAPTPVEPATAGSEAEASEGAAVPAVGVVLDHTVLAALGAGHRLLARLLYTRPARHTRRMFAPAQAVLNATAQRPRLNSHVKRLEDVLECVDFDLDAVAIIGEQVADNVHPAVGHVVHVAQPSTAWPMGRPVLTMFPEMYQPYRVKVRAIPER